MSVSSDSLVPRRAAYAREVTTRYTAPGADEGGAVEAAFASVPRERFLGPPPWKMGDGGWWKETSRPAELYRDKLVALVDAKGINNGQPSLHALCIAALRLTKRDHVLHIGAGTGYYTAILAELAGLVDAYEIETELAVRAAAVLAAWPNVVVHAESGAGRVLPEADAIYVNAGVSAPDRHWLDALREDGRLLFPLTGEDRFGGMLLIQRLGRVFAARFLSQCGFIHCAGARDPDTAARLAEAFRAGGQDSVRSFCLVKPPDEAIWFAGDGWYLSTEPP